MNLIHGMWQKVCLRNWLQRPRERDAKTWEPGFHPSLPTCGGVPTLARKKMLCCWRRSGCQWYTMSPTSWLAREQTLPPLCPWAPWWREPEKQAVAEAWVWSPQSTGEDCDWQAALERPGSPLEVRLHNNIRGIYASLRLISNAGVWLHASEVAPEENALWLWCDGPCFDAGCSGSTVWIGSR